MSLFTDTLTLLESQHRLREIPHADTEGRIDLLSNDYMGLASEAESFMPEFLSRFSDASFSSSASRLLSRNQKYHIMLEEHLESLYSRPALLFNSGYHANAGAMAALSGKDTLIIIDKLMHASAIDGMMQGVQSSRGRYIRFVHNDMTSLRSILEKNAGQFRHMIVVTESIFSMDGDLAPLREITEMKKDFPEMIIYLDEAHAFGVRGERGLGLAEELGLIAETDIIVGTFGKAAASSGAFVSASAEIRDYLVNTARSFIFSTAAPPVCQAWTLMMINKLEGMNRQRTHLRNLCRDFAAALRGKTDIPDNAGHSQIIPVMCGSAEKALSVAQSVREAGYDVLPIRRPTVAAGSERIRISLNSSLCMHQLQPLVETLQRAHL